MSPFGVTETGFRLKRLEDIREELEQDFRAEFGENIDLSADNPLGQIITIVSARRADDWLAMQHVYNSFWASMATGISLDRVGELRGVSRRQDSYSTGFVTFIGTPGVEIPAGTRLRDAQGRQAETLATVALHETVGEATTGVRAVDPGPVYFAPSTLNTLVTSIFGVDTVFNDGEVMGGLYMESDEEFRIRSNAAILSPGTSTAEGIRNAVNALPYIRDTIVTQNVTDSVDGSGRPPHSFEVYFLSNLTGAIIDYPTEQMEIARAIWNAKPAGIESVGQVETIVTDKYGFQHPIRMTEATRTNVIITVSVVPNNDAQEGELFPMLGAELVRDSILEYGSTLNMGRDVWLNRIISAASSVPGVKGVSGVTINGVAANLSISAIELPVFLPENITVVVL